MATPASAYRSTSTRWSEQGLPILAGFGVALVGVALGVYEWLYYRVWTHSQPRYFHREATWWWFLLRPWHSEFSPRWRRIGLIVGEAVATFLLALGIMMMVSAGV